jgi:drug/metabolite transporter (DMT)-like permease
MLVTLLVFVTTLAFGFVGQTLIKSGLNHAALGDRTGLDWAIHAYLNTRVIAGTFTVGVGFLLWVVVLSRLDLSQAMPLLALTYVPWLIIARWVLREEVTVPQWIGVGLVSVGVFLIMHK